MKILGEGNGNPLQCSCLENPGTGEPGTLPSTGLHRVGHDWSDLAAAALPFLIIHLSPFTRDLHLFIRLTVTVEDLSFQPEGLPAQEGRVVENSRSSHELGMPQSLVHVRRTVLLNVGFLVNSCFPSTFQRHSPMSSDFWGSRWEICSWSSWKIFSQLHKH